MIVLFLNICLIDKKCLNLHQLITNYGGNRRSNQQNKRQ